jgi:hypothetical protein
MLLSIFMDLQQVDERRNEMVLMFNDQFLQISLGHPNQFRTFHGALTIA